MTQHEHEQHRRRLAAGQKPERHGELMLESRGAGHLPALYRQPGSGSPPAAA